jgi:hypothetical protein
MRHLARFWIAGPPWPQAKDCSILVLYSLDLEPPMRAIAAALVVFAAAVSAPALAQPREDFVELNER